MNLEFEYGQGMMNACLPDNTDLFIPGETVRDPECIPPERLEEEYLKSLRNPMGCHRLANRRTGALRW